MLTFLLWCILFVLSWPPAILALVVYPIVWLLLLPFRLLGIAVFSLLDLAAPDHTAGPHPEQADVNAASHRPTRCPQTLRPTAVQSPCALPIESV